MRFINYLLRFVVYTEKNIDLFNTFVPNRFAMGSVEQSNVKKEIKCHFCDIPFKKTLSFEYLIRDIENIAEDANSILNSSAKDLLKKLEDVPELRGEIKDNSVMEKHDTLLKQLMSFVFNPLNCKEEITAAFKPFEMEPFFSSQRYKKTIGAENKRVDILGEDTSNANIIPIIYQAYCIILDKVYNYKLPVEIPFTFKLTDSQNQSVKYYNKNFDISYLQVKPIAKLKELKHEDITALFDRDHDLDFWNEIIPLDKFEFRGFMRFKYNNITREHVVSELKSDLLDKNTIVSVEGYKRIQEKIRSLMDNPLVRFGLVSFSNDIESGGKKSYLWKPIVADSKLRYKDYEGSIYQQAFEEKRIILTRDLKEGKQTSVKKELLDNGISSHAVVPLIIDDKVVGMLEFGCPLLNSLTLIQVKMLYDLFPVFALAIKRSQEEWNDKVRALIQEKFTAIHPTVEWRFKEAASKILNSREDTASVDRIVFSDIVPIYGASDIRGSSLARNHAIQADLSEQLEWAYEILKIEKVIRDIPLLSDVSYKIQKHLRTLKLGLKAGDEVSIVEFLKNEIDPFLRLIKDRDPELTGPVDKYFEMLDPELGVLYKKRKDFEDSLTLINDHVSDIIDKEQEKAQDVFPHYFEKYRTDGIEYNGYLGQSLVKDLKYNEMYLKNIRLWQLLVKVKIARKINQIQSELRTKLDITQLILVHSNPLSIEFRQDEKKFDVAGAYNIRYEITKKRIDKALVKGTNERVTQVGKIAIIYSYVEEIAEYKRYIDYMMAQGYLTGDLEELELEDLKGASGLKALRVQVNFKNEKSCHINQQVLQEVTDE
ncbi:GAF domain-containing protein [Saccharicrinis fermentans]|uniref:GAF domain-containing protein n=1 Tax=Saccharicrinis fermentans TaxID=982 RepID=UPI0012B633E1|nr:GAF domain-containing protein [Saccharicrinis fermentans]